MQWMWYNKRFIAMITANLKVQLTNRSLIAWINTFFRRLNRIIVVITIEYIENIPQFSTWSFLIINIGRCQFLNSEFDSMEHKYQRENDEKWNHFWSFVVLNSCPQISEGKHTKEVLKNQVMRRRFSAP